MSQKKAAWSPAWDDAIDLFVVWREMEGKTRGTLELRAYHLRAMSHALAKEPFEVALEDLMVFLHSKRERKGEYRKALRSSIRSFYEWAYKTGRMSHNPALELPRIKTDSKNPRPVREEDYLQVLKVLEVSDPRVRMMCILAGNLGLRRAEVAQVSIDDLTEDSEGLVLKVLGKGSKTRYIPISKKFAIDLRSFITTYGDGHWAFPNGYGSHLSPHWVGTKVSRVLPEGYTMHKLRHRAATQTYEETGDIVVTADLLGHSSTTVTQRYVKPDRAKLRGALERIAS